MYVVLFSMSDFEVLQYRGCDGLGWVGFGCVMGARRDVHVM